MILHPVVFQASTARYGTVWINGLEQGMDIPIYYDPMLAKLIALETP
jgi:acetyl/propionyl-CoA carboxylase alpha subunit